MTALPSAFHIGEHQAAWIWGTTDDPHGADSPRVGAIPAGVIIDHGEHTMILTWVDLPVTDGRLTLESLQPLTIVEPVHCSACNITGKIERGAWVPVEGEVLGG